MKLQILFFIIFFYNIAYATSQELFLRAADAYKKGNFSQALTIFTSIENKGAAVWYNIGNTYYQMNEYVAALIAWKRALKCNGAYLSAGINANSKQVYEKLNLMESDNYWHWAINNINKFSLYFWQIIFICSLYGLLLLLYMVTKKKWWMIGLCLLITNGAGVGLLLCWYTMNVQTGTVIKETFLVAGNDEQFSKIGTLKPGQEVSIKGENESWCKVTVDNQIGWVLKNNIEFI